MEVKYILVVVFLIGIFGEARTEDANKDSDMIGWTVIITSVMDESVVTVLPNGDVKTEKLVNNLDTQRWTIAKNPYDPAFLEFKQAVVPYNMFSGYEPKPGEEGIFPRPFSLAAREKVKDVTTWNILIRGRWCIQANGIGYQMDQDDCENFFAPWQLWKITKV